MNTRKDNIDFYLIDCTKEELDVFLTSPQMLEQIAKRYSTPVPEVIDRIQTHLDAWLDSQIDTVELFTDEDYPAGDHVSEADYDIDSEGFDAIFEEVMR
jgi:hypothetical protein